ncbi:hypothetical protein MNAN1_002347 [Malassezia nana]|uniref:SH3 domain-containing protein n=1 Tax=Malassezia nana TaxID=180528 RepID=A0AAF0J2Q5_9BASI|nr:hypothetical protein MNAN1_002347 [Malassezia nana]
MSSIKPVIDLDAEAVVSSPESLEASLNPPLSIYAAQMQAPDTKSQNQGAYEAELALSGVLRILDFAFDVHDERYFGYGSVIPSKGLPPSQHYVAIYDFTPEADNELPLQAGMPVEAFPPEKDGWILAKDPDHPEKCGLVPYTYLQPVG